MFSGKKILVTGGTGMIGSHLAELLLETGASVRITEHNTKAKNIFPEKTRDELEIIKADLTRPDECRKAVKEADMVFQLAACLTGVLGNRATPVRMFTPNVLIQTNMMHAAHEENVGKYLLASSACIYPSSIQIPYKEEDGLSGWPDENNEAHAWAKRLGELQAKYYHKEFGMRIAIARPFNSYGPRDNFHHESSHVIAGLIRKALEPGKELKLWGDGRATRDFVYVTDSARAMMKIMEKVNDSTAINIASGMQISIIELAQMILEICESDRKLVFDKNKPIGQDKRVGSTERLDTLGFRCTVGLREGLTKTIEWYKNNKKSAKEYDI